ncbi:hypothetical protein OG897_13260 [Streptomyces sp. NBC_00237]|uniref:hypothetical protein n=1 Tax=Streptomyces sp. NBC_00237 TaxID=2975687 RepID=UPI00224E722B|nr:hypothetical protein [Streptomyces sp. NBC_00237]MCX5202411.1 hypothetical protein [Streptomyces sp. NBC_00237]
MTHTFYLADYAGAVDGPWLYPTPATAQGLCDELAAPDAAGRSWDWIELEGEWVQVWTHSDTDAPTGRTGGTVTEIDGTAVRDAILRDAADQMDGAAKILTGGPRADLVPGLIEAARALRSDTTGGAS